MALFGGPIFPLLFASTMIGLALQQLFPSVPLSILVMCIEGPTLGLVLGAPLTAILLVTVIGTADPDSIALIVLSTVVGMLVGKGFKQALARRGAQKVSANPVGVAA